MARPRSDIAERIVHAAHDRFLHEGVDAVSLRTIARDAGTNIGMIYYYFPTKDDLFMAVVEEVYVGALGDLEQVLARDRPVRERLTLLYRRISKLDRAEVDVFLIIVREILGSSDRRDRLIERFQRGHLPLVIATIRDGLTSGMLDARQHPVVLMLATFVLGVIPQLVIRFARDKLPVPGAPAGEELARALLDILLDGIAARPPAEAGQPGEAQAKEAKEAKDE